MSDSTAAESGRTALRVAAVVLLVLVVAPFVVTGVPSVVGAEESFVVLSGSMNAEPEPVIQPGDVVIVDGVDPAAIEEQDIITFTNGGEEPVTHRVVNVTEQDGQPAFRTKGDANEDADARLVGPDQLVGEVVFVIPLIGHVVNYANTTQGFVLLVLLPIGLLVLSEVWNLVATTGESDEGEPAGPVEPGRERPVGATHAAGTAHAGGTHTTGENAETGGEESDEEPSTVTLGKTQAKWFTVGLVLVAAATGYVAFRLQTAWILTVFFASVGLCLLFGLVYLRIAWGSSGPEAAPGAAGRAGVPVAAAGGLRSVTDEDGDGDAASPARPVVEGRVRRPPVVTGRIEEDLGDDSRVEVSVDSPETLVEMALERGTWVVRDAETGAHVLVDGEMVFRYEGDDPVPDSAANREAASGWISFPGTEDGERRAHGNGSDPERDDGERERDHEGKAESNQAVENVVEPIAPDGNESSDTDEPPSCEVSRAEVGGTLTADADGESPTRPASAQDGHDLTPASRPVEDEAVTGSSSDSSTPEGTEETTDGSARADGGETDDLPPVIGRVGRLVDLPIRMLGFLGYLTVEPPMALYRALRPHGRDDENESRTGSDGRSEREP